MTLSPYFAGCGASCFFALTVVVVTCVGALKAFGDTATTNAPSAQPSAVTNTASQSTPLPQPPTPPSTPAPENWTVNGKDYHNVTVGEVEADRVHITYDGGIGTVMLADLTPELKKRFNYDPDAAKAAAAQEAAREAASDLEVQRANQTQQTEAAKEEAAKKPMSEKHNGGDPADLAASQRELQRENLIEQQREEQIDKLMKARWAQEAKAQDEHAAQQKVENAQEQASVQAAQEKARQEEASPEAQKRRAQGALFLYGVVMQKTNEGILIHLDESDRGLNGPAGTTSVGMGTFFLTNYAKENSVVDGDVVESVVYPTGPYTYTTVLGARSTIHSYSAVPPGN